MISHEIGKNWTMPSSPVSASPAAIVALTRYRSLDLHPHRKFWGGTFIYTTHDIRGPFFHGTIANLESGQCFEAGHRSNYRPEVVMNHVYFTALVNGAGLAAELAAELTGGEATPRVYEVEPTGGFEDDPNVTDKKFPGNPTRSYHTRAPLRVIREITDWERLTPEARQMWRERLINVPADRRGEILN